MLGRRVILDADGHIQLRAFRVPTPGPSQILIRTSITQISAGTELVALRRRRSSTAPKAAFADFPLGYTSVGVVEAVGSGVSSFAAGDRVVGMGNHATHWLVTRDESRIADGIAPEDELLPIPDDVGEVSAAFAILGDVALHAIRHARIAFGESVAVHGLGAVGLLALRLARLCGGHPLIGIDPVASRRAIAHSFGATHLIDPRTVEPAGAIRTATSGPRRFRGPSATRLEPNDGADVQIHATSNIDVFPVMLRAAADRGRVVIAGATAPWPEDGGDPATQEGPTTPVGLNEVLRREISVVGSYQTGFLDSHPYWPWTRSRNRAIVLDLIRRGEIDVTPLVTQIVPAEEAASMYDMLLTGSDRWVSVALRWDA